MHIVYSYLSDVQLCYCIISEECKIATIQSLNEKTKKKKKTSEKKMTMLMRMRVTMKRTTTKDESVEGRYESVTTADNICQSCYSVIYSRAVVLKVGSPGFILGVREFSG